MSEWTRDFLTPKFVVALVAVCIFGWAYGENVGDETMKGAIIGGFNLALGFYLGSTSNSSRASENTGKAFDAVLAATQAGVAQASGKPNDPVHTVTEDPR